LLNANTYQVGWCIEASFFWSTCFTKCSVLMFYRHLVAGTFSIKLRVAVWVGVTVLVLYSISFQILALTTCLPIASNWRQFDVTYTSKYHCLSMASQIRIVQAGAVLSVGTDFYSVMLPACMLMQIPMSMRQRIGIGFVLTMGFVYVTVTILAGYGMVC
jgi:hypothetical protein